MSLPVATSRLISPPASLAGLIANKEPQMSRRRGGSLGLALGPPLHHLPAIRWARGGGLGGRGRGGGQGRGSHHRSSGTPRSVHWSSRSTASCSRGLGTSSRSTGRHRGRSRGSRRGQRGAELDQLVNLGMEFPKVGPQDVQPILHLLQFRTEHRLQARKTASPLQPFLKLLNPGNPVSLSSVGSS